MNKAYIEPVLNCTFKLNFDLIVTLGASEPLGGHIGGKGPVSLNILLSILNCISKPNFNNLGTLRALEPLGGHIGG